MNNGVYKCGFSTRQAGFTAAEAELFATLDELEAVLRRAPGAGVACSRASGGVPGAAGAAPLTAALPPPAPPRSRQRFVCGERFTEADLRLFPTVVRFDAVYAVLFKCCRRRIAEYPHLQARGGAGVTGFGGLAGAACGVKDAT